MSKLYQKLNNKYITLLGLYLAQSIPMSFFSTVVPVIMRQENYSLESIGMLQLIKLPWIFKFLWAPLVDRNGNTPAHYRRWILASELFYAVIIIGLGFFNLQTDFTTIIVLVVIAFIASATQDIATDAFAILQLSKKERSMGNSIQSSGSFLGTLVGSGVMLIIYHTLGWQYLMMALAGFVLLALLPLMASRKRVNDIKPRKITPITMMDLIRFFGQKGIVKRIVLLLLFYSGLIGILAMLRPYMVDLGYSIKEIGFISGVFGTAIGACFSFVAGYIIKQKGRKTGLLVAVIAGLIAASFFAIISQTEVTTPMIYVGVAILWSAYSMSSVAVFTISMDKVRKGREGTDFTLQIVITHLSSVIMAVLSGKIAGAFSYSTLFMIEAGICMMVLILVPFLYEEEGDN
ncbi:MFS transporter [Marinilabiliaceae bacterium JC017]|nr:MFS transporter [Marinilabiliaceae bacterium JC017]